MNRKERRIQEKMNAKVTPKQIPTSHVAEAERHKQLGFLLKNADHLEKSLAPLVRALQLNPSLADVHFALAVMARTKPELNINMSMINASLTNRNALVESYVLILAILREKEQISEAEICTEELINLVPEDPRLLIDLAILRMFLSKRIEAAKDAAKAVNMRPEEPIFKNVMTQTLFNTLFTQFIPEVKTAILHCFKEIYEVDLCRIYKGWFSLLIHDPIYAGPAAAMLSPTNEKISAWLDTINHDNGDFLKEDYFLYSLKYILVSIPCLEILVTGLRRYICLNFKELKNTGRIQLFDKLLMALGEQCFLNEYIFVYTDEEIKIIESIKPDSTINVALISCYKPLYQTFINQHASLIALSKREDYQSLIKTQIKDPLEEERLKTNLPIYGEFANEISRRVQNQYEENPYPRWVSIALQSSPRDAHPVPPSDRHKPYSILIAGCGTGRHAMSTAVMFPNSKITAIDLSKASLAYGKRKAIEAGIADRIEFINADILSMADWPEQFDIIESSGVLHHMEDPFAGWKTLTSILKPRGYMKIALYSELARQPIVAARREINEKGFATTHSGISAFRQYVMGLPNENHMKQTLVNSPDFYSTSLVRDLVFHIQEHRMTLPQIKDMMQELGLDLTSIFVLDSDVGHEYRKMFPADPKFRSIENWIIFEKAFPNTFTGMYQFGCQKS